jgi:prevent-host-death family protein
MEDAAVGIEIELAEAQMRLAELIDSLKGGGEILIIRDGQPVARLLPVDEVGPDRVPGSAKGPVRRARQF